MSSFFGPVMLREARAQGIDHARGVGPDRQRGLGDVGEFVRVGDL